jgi:hypothetical protein
MEYVQMTLTDWMSIKKELEDELRGAAAGFVRIGYLLRKIDESEGYKQDGCDSLTEWAEKEYGLSASSVSRFIAINKRYSIDGYSKQLRIEFAKYGQAKLQEMLTLPEEALQMISPEMKRADIREVKAFEKQAPHEEPAEQQGDIAPWIIEFIRANDLQSLRNTRAYAENDLDQLISEVNPTGTKTFRYKRTMVSMFADRIMVREFPNPPEQMAWREFFDIIMPLISAEEPEEMPEEVQEVLTEEEKVPEQVQEMPKTEPEMPKPVEKEEKTVADQQAAGTPEEIAPAQKSPSPIVSNNVKTDSAIAEEPAPEPAEELEQVEIDEILPAPEGPDPMRDLKDRFTAEMNSLRVMLDCDNFSGMAQTIERLEHLRIKMAGLAALK